MKKLLTLSVSALLVCEAFAQLTVSEPTIVALQSEYGNVRPRIALNAAQEPVVIWCASADEKLYSSKMENGSFTTPQQLNPDGIGISSFDWYGPEIAASGNNMAVVMKLEPENSAHIYIVSSTDGGETWSDTVLVENSLPLMSRMPSLGMDEAGNPYVTFLREDMMGFSEWAIAKSTDGGQSFLPAVSTSINFTDAVCDCCPSATLVNSTNVIVLYRNNEDNLRDIRASISDDGGETFATQADMDDLNWEINACPSTGPSAIFANNQLNSVWYSDATGDGRVYFSAFDLENSTFEGSVEVFAAASNENQNYPSLAGDDGQLALVYEHSQTGQRNIHFLHSATEEPFSGAALLDLTSEMSGNQMRPHMVYADGVYHIVYTDNGGDAVVYQTISLPNNIGENSTVTGLNISVFPNPAHDVLQIQTQPCSEILAFEITDQLGRVCADSHLVSANKKLSVDISALGSGTYNLRVVTTGDIKTTTTFFKQD